MLPVSDYRFAEDAVGRLSAAGAVAYGYVLYGKSDHSIVEYMKDDGLYELDAELTDQHGLKVGLYLFEPYDGRWIDYARECNNLWWRAFGPTPAPAGGTLPKPSGPPADLKRAVYSSENVIIQVEAEERMRMWEFPTGDWMRSANAYYNSGAVISIIDRHKIDRSALPIVILYAGMKPGRYRWWSFSELQTEQGVINSIFGLFTHPEFLEILEEAEKADG